MTVYTVGDLLKELQQHDPDLPVAIYANGRRMQFFAASEEVCQDSFYGPAPIYIYGHDEDKAVFNVLFLGDSAASHSQSNRRIARHKGEEITVEAVRTMTQLDPKPWVYTDPVSKAETRLAERRDDVPMQFSPERGFSQNQEDY